MPFIKKVLWKKRVARQCHWKDKGAKNSLPISRSNFLLRSVFCFYISTEGKKYPCAWSRLNV